MKGDGTRNDGEQLKDNPDLLERVETLVNDLRITASDIPEVIE